MIGHWIGVIHIKFLYLHENNRHIEGESLNTLRPSLENVLLDGRTPQKRFNIFQELVVTRNGIIGHYLPDVRDNTGD